MPKKFTQQEFIEKARCVHDSKYDYSKVVYVKATEKVEIGCNTCNQTFLQKPFAHLQGQGCPNCAKTNRIVSKTWTAERFIQAAQKVHGNKFNYSHVEYKNSQTKVEIICNSCLKSFHQKPNAHLNGQGCGFCSRSRRLTKQEFVDLFIARYQDRPYSFEKSVYTNSHTPMVVTCHLHGDFKIKPNCLLNGNRCRHCAKESSSQMNMVSFDEFERRARQIHGNQYKYDSDSYIGINSKVKIYCETHGWFEQVGSDHTGGHMCKICARNLNGFGRRNFIAVCNRKKQKHGFLYVIKCNNSDEEFYKIGITSYESILKRFNDKVKLPYEFKLIYMIKGESGSIYDLEKLLHKELKSERYRPKIDFKGSVSECFSNLSNQAKTIIENYKNR